MNVDVKQIVTDNAADVLDSFQHMAASRVFETDTNQYKNKRFDQYLRLKKDVPAKAIIPYLEHLP